MRFVDTEVGQWEEGELDEGSQKIQTTSYKISKYQGYNVQHDKLTLLYGQRSLTGDRKESDTTQVT